MFLAKKRMLIPALVVASFLFAVHRAECSAVSSTDYTDESLPKLSDIVLFKLLAVKVVQAIPDKAIKQINAQVDPKEVKDQLKQVIIAGSDIFQLALEIQSGELTKEFKEKLTTIRNEFKKVNGKLVAESKKIQDLKAQLKKASPEEQMRLIQDETAIMLDMFNSMSEPMFNVSVAFKDLNNMLVAQLLQVLELIPPIKPYLTVGDGNDKITLSKFMGVKLQEMIKYTEALKKIGANLKKTYQEMQADMLECKNTLQKSYQAASEQKKLLPKG